MDRLSETNVLLLKEPVHVGNDPYIQFLSRLGFSAHCIPVLAFQFRDLQGYSSLLQQYNSYAAIIFTSQQAVRATALVLDNIKDGSVTSGIRNLRCYVVGKATGLAAENIGFSARGSFCGNAEELSQFIVHDMMDLKSRTVLFACGSLRKDVIPVSLVSQGHPVQEAVVYETVYRKEIHDDVKTYIETRGKPNVIVFFSPSGVQALLLEGQNKNLLSLSDMKVIAFGPSTRAELERYGCRVFRTLSKPTPQDLGEALQN